MSILLVVGAIVCGSLAAYAVQHYIETTVDEERDALYARFELVDVVVANRDLEPGNVLDARSAALDRMPREFARRSAVQAHEWEEIAGMQIDSAVPSGEMILRGDLTDSYGRGLGEQLQDGLRAVTLSVGSESMIAGMLRPRDRVDLLLTLRGDGERFTYPLLSDVEVMAVDDHVNPRAMGNGSRRGGRELTFGVSPREAALITHAKQLGDFHVVMRRGDDHGSPESIRIADSDLLGIEPAVEQEKSEAAPVRYIFGGVAR